MADDEYIRELCADFLGGNWDQHRDLIHIECIRRGFAHEVFHCLIGNGEESEDVIVKIFCSEQTKQYSRYAFQGMVGEMVIFSLLSTAGIAPKLLATFNEGRIEEYIEGRNLENEDFHSDPSLYATLAKLLVKFHLQSMPITKRINYFGKLVNEMNKSYEYSVEDFHEDERIHFRSIINFPLDNELEWIIKNVPNIKSKTVFSHNNVYPGNLILKQRFTSQDDRLMLIDYEVSGYNYRGYDIGFLLNNSCYRFSDVNGKIVIQFEGETKPQIEHMFVEEYLNELSKIHELHGELDTVDHLVMECKFFKLFAQLALICFAKGLIHAPNWSHQIGSFNILTLWTHNYNSQKEMFCKTYSHIIE